MKISAADSSPWFSCVQRELRDSRVLPSAWPMRTGLDAGEAATTRSATPDAARTNTFTNGGNFSLGSRWHFLPGVGSGSHLDLTTCEWAVANPEFQAQVADSTRSRRVLVVCSSRGSNEAAA